MLVTLARLSTRGRFNVYQKTSLTFISKAGKGNPAPGVGGTAKDGGLSTGATVADGGPDDGKADSTYKP